MGNKQFKYQVAFSFAGEDREYVEAVANILLNEKGIDVFYDLDKQLELWGSNLLQELTNIYENESKYVVIFISQKYLEKDWTKFELEAAKRGALKYGRPYILPARFDGTDILQIGLGDNIDLGYIDLRGMTYNDFAQYVIRKLNLKEDKSKVAINHLGRGNFYYDNCEYNKAIEKYSEAIALDPEYTRAYYNRLTIDHTIYGKNRYCVYNVAMKKLKAEITGSFDADAIFAEAKEAVQNTEYQQASILLERYLQLKPAKAEAWRMKGFADFQNGDHALSEVANAQALSLDPSDSYATKGIGLAVFHQRKMDERIKLVEKAAQMGDADAAKELEALKYERQYGIPYPR
jgi:tetratricopeptide (TPR) repeat protein